MSDFGHMYLLLVVASLGSLPTTTGCPAHCTCNNKSVLCRQTAVGSFPSGIPAETEAVQIQGTHDNPCQIKHLGATDLSHLTSLNILTISHTLLEEVDKDAFRGLTGLRSVDLSFNKLTALPPGLFNDLTALVSLHLTGNPQLSMPSALLTGSPNLRELYLSDIGMSDLDLEVFRGLNSLVYLDLSNNHLDFLPPGVADPAFLPGLRSLDLSYNRLTYLANVTAALFSRVLTVELYSNPWQCTCELAWLQRFPAHIFPAHQGNKAALCQGPPDVANMALALLKPSQLICTLPKIVHCDPVSPTLSGATLEVRCNMTGLPFPFVSWKLPDGSTNIGSSRRQLSPLMRVQPPLVTITLMAGKSTNGTVVVMAHNVYGVGMENIRILVKDPPTTTPTITTTAATVKSNTDSALRGPKTGVTNTTGRATGRDMEERRVGDVDAGNSVMTYVSAGGGGLALLLSVFTLAVVCRKLNKDRVVPFDPEQARGQRGKRGEEGVEKWPPEGRKSGRDRRGGHTDSPRDDHQAIQDVGSGPGEACRLPSNSRPVSAWGSV